MYTRAVLAGLVFGVPLVAADHGVPPPALRVCLEPHFETPCQSGPVEVDGVISAFGASGTAKLRWAVDGRTREEVTIELADGETSHNLLVFTPRASHHTLTLEVSLGQIRNRAVLDLAPEFCPFDLGVETIAFEAGTNLIVGVVNHGPGPSGSWRLRLLVDGSRAYASPMDSLAAGGRYELVVPWSDLVSGGTARRGRAPTGGPGPRGGRRRGHTVLVLLDASEGDLDPGNDVVEAFVPD